MDSKEINKAAIRLASYFFMLKSIRPTPAMMRTAIGQARNLINAEYTEQEITECILYTINHPPQKGFTSLGWLSYTIAETLNKIKVQKIKETKQEEPAVVKENINLKELNKNKQSKDNATKSKFNLDMFKK